MTTISVIVTTYGAGEWKEQAHGRALPSLIAQGDDLADDVVFRHEDGGTRRSSLNNGASLATGDWLIFLDADDELAPGYVGAMRRALEQPGDGLRLFTPAVQTVRAGNDRGTPRFFDRGISLREDNWLVIGTMVHKDLFWRVGGFDDHPHGFEDWALWSKCWRVGATVVKVPDAIYRYHHNPRSKHKQEWRNRRWQVETHMRVKKELDEWEAALT